MQTNAKLKELLHIENVLHRLQDKPTDAQNLSVLLSPSAHKHMQSLSLFLSNSLNRALVQK